MACLIKFTGDHIFTFINHAVLHYSYLSNNRYNEFSINGILGAYYLTCDKIIIIIYLYNINI